LPNLPVADLLGGTMMAVMGILAALFDAARTGHGRHVDVDHQGREYPAKPIEGPIHTRDPGCSLRLDPYRIA
jgi:hypothetical protein